MSCLRVPFSGISGAAAAAGSVVAAAAGAVVALSVPGAAGASGAGAGVAASGAAASAGGAASAAGFFFLAAGLGAAGLASAPGAGALLSGAAPPRHQRKPVMRRSTAEAASRMQSANIFQGEDSWCGPPRVPDSGNLHWRATGTNPAAITPRRCVLPVRIGPEAKGSHRLGRINRYADGVKKKG